MRVGILEDGYLCTRYALISGMAITDPRLAAAVYACQTVTDLAVMQHGRLLADYWRQKDVSKDVTRFF